MNDHETRIAIAEACGWTLVAEGSANPPPVSFRLCPVCNCIGSRHEGASGMELACANEGHAEKWVAAWDQWTKDRQECVDNPPDYLNSLDAMHEAEQTLSRGPGEEWNRYAHYLSVICERPIHATAKQRAQAFVRTIAARAERREEKV